MLSFLYGLPVKLLQQHIDSREFIELVAYIRKYGVVREVMPKKTAPLNQALQQIQHEQKTIGKGKRYR